MEKTQGQFLVSMPALDDPSFIRCVIFVIEKNENGALGFIINKKSGRKLNELEEFSACKGFPFFAGGPVSTDKIFILHGHCDTIGYDKQSDEICLGGDFTKALDIINNGLDASHIKLFLGYCGWDRGELENEIEEGSWKLVKGNKDWIFASNEDLWDSIMDGETRSA